MPRFMALIMDSYDNAVSEGDGAEWDAVMAEYNAFGAEAGAAGVITGGGEALQPPTTAVEVRRVATSDGEIIRVDAPFAEAKEVCGGFYLLDCADVDEAVQWAAKIPGAWRSSRIIVQPCVDFGG